MNHVWSHWKKNNWPVWKTVWVGLLTKEDLLREFITKNPNHCKYLEIYIKAMKRIAKAREIQLALVSVKDLGFTSESTRRGDVLDRLKQSGLGRLPAVAGFCLKTQYGNQLEAEKFHMATNPIILPKFGACGLFLFGKFITCANADPTNSLSLDCRFACRIL